MKIELLDISDSWVSSEYESRKELLSEHEKTSFITETDEYKYYTINEKPWILYRIPKKETMTKKEAEDKYDIIIED